MEGLQAVTVFFKSGDTEVIENVKDDGIIWGSAVLTLDSTGCFNQFPIAAVDRILARPQKDYMDDQIKLARSKTAMIEMMNKS